MDNERKDVYKGYDIIAGWFAENRPQSLMERPWLDKVITIIGENANALDLGCGTGMPMMHYLLKKGIQVTGVDASHSLLEIAKENFPSIEFFQQDMRQLNLHRKFDAIIAWHSFFHLPPEDQPAMFPVFRTHLKSNGILLFTSGTEYGEVWGINGGVICIMVLWIHINTKNCWKPMDSGYCSIRKMILNVAMQMFGWRR